MISYFTIVALLLLVSLMINCYYYFQYSEDIESGFSSDVESKYKKIYEDDINPFAAFSKKVFFLLAFF